MSQNPIEEVSRPLDAGDQARLAEAVSHIEGRIPIPRDAEPYLTVISARRLLRQKRG